MTRGVFRLAAVVCIAPLAVGCGGGRAAVTPSLPTTGSAATAGAVSQQPLSAVRGVRTIVHLPLRNADELENLVAQQSQQGSPQYHVFLTPQQFAARYAPSSSDLAAAAAALKSLGFTTQITTQSVVADADQATVQRAFNVTLRSVSTKGRTVLAADRAATVPATLQALHPSIAVSPKWVVHKDSVRAGGFTNGLVPDDRYGAYSEYWFTDLKEAYSYPAVPQSNGAGRTIAIVMSNKPQQSDLQAYFDHEQFTAISGKPVPMLQFVDIDGGGPYDPNYSDEVELDTQQSLGSAPGANEIVYDMPDLSFSAIYDAYQQAITDNKADIVSSSFGEGELFFTAAYNGGTDYSSIVTQQFHDLFLQGNAQGITFVASSDDMGANGCVDPNVTTAVKCVSWPADDPNVTGVGGTNLGTTTLPAPKTPGYPYSYALTSKYKSENANYDPLAVDIWYTGGPALPGEIWGSGGGVSTLFPEPLYQRLARNVIKSGRNVPDIAMHMGGCPQGAVTPCAADRSFDVIYMGGQRYGVIGTSASAPEFAGLLAITEQNLGTRLGNANWYIYALAAVAGDRAFHHRIIPGNNGGYATSTAGYDQVIGVGTPYGNLFSADPFAGLAGDPQTTSNP
ncbi:MAG TPA: S53 family peptidase [Candidatus Limnocylindria bacterium]|jgi:subtilase family serine protease|nr:S53 family peptidase [Candidatus Limnocylindria bacterium]